MLLGDLALMVVSFLWGLTNVVIRDALDGITPLWFCGLRFPIALITVMIFFGKRAFAMNKREKISGLLLGAIFVSAYPIGAVALLYTKAANESFIISMSSVTVPLVTWMMTRKFPGWHIIVAVVLCTIGAAGLVFDANMTANWGDILCIGCLIAVTIYMLLLNKFAPECDPLGFSCWQAVGGCILAVAIAVLFEPFPAHIPMRAWLALIYAGTAAFALTLVLQTWAQAHTSATHAALILACSGVFATVIECIFMNEPLTLRAAVSSLLIMLGIVSIEIIPLMHKESK